MWPAASFSDSLLTLHQKIFNRVSPFFLFLFTWFEMPWPLWLPTFDCSLEMQPSEQVWCNLLRELLFHSWCFFLSGWYIWWRTRKNWIEADQGRGDRPERWRGINALKMCHCCLICSGSIPLTLGVEIRPFSSPQRGAGATDCWHTGASCNFFLSLLFLST